MPKAGIRKNSDANLPNQSTTGHYWSSVIYSNNVAHFLYFYSENVYPNYGNSVANASSVRCIKNY